VQRSWTSFGGLARNEIEILGVVRTRDKIPSVVVLKKVQMVLGRPALVRAHELFDQGSFGLDGLGSGENDL
jgi:hypothetical protein